MQNIAKGASLGIALRTC